MRKIFKTIVIKTNIFLQAKNYTQKKCRNHIYFYVQILSKNLLSYLIEYKRKKDKK